MVILAKAFFARRSTRVNWITADKGFESRMKREIETAAVLLMSPAGFGEAECGHLCDAKNAPSTVADAQVHLASNL